MPRVIENGFKHLDGREEVGQTDEIGSLADTLQPVHSAVLLRINSVLDAAERSVGIGHETFPHVEVDNLGSIGVKFYIFLIQFVVLLLDMSNRSRRNSSCIKDNGFSPSSKSGGSCQSTAQAMSSKRELRPFLFQLRREIHGEPNGGIVLLTRTINEATDSLMDIILPIFNRQRFGSAEGETDASGVLLLEQGVIEACVATTQEIDEVTALADPLVVGGGEVLLLDIVNASEEGHSDADHYIVVEIVRLCGELAIGESFLVGFDVKIFRQHLFFRVA
mmetsp:Transcript_21394/g.46632  ORF Transcript_21394/g.46632 Transcript_21394/m.46632 type:complete len:277 (+) Transcript_21394:354-1184(+)